MKYVDPDGEILETAWDAFSLTTGALSFAENVKNGNAKGAVLDGLGVVVDAAALILPCIPGGVGALIKGSKTVNASENVLSALASSSKLDNYVKGAPVLGHYPEYVNLAKEIDGKTFEMPVEIFDKMTKSEQWTANKKFLDRAIERGESFNLATPIRKMRQNSFYEEEVNYLLEKGYKLNESGTMLIPGVE